MAVHTTVREQRVLGAGCWVRRAKLGLLVASGLAFGALACRDATDQGTLPPEVRDPGATHTPSGAVARYRGALAVLPGVLDSLVTLTGILTDELASLPAPLGVARNPYTGIDSRQAVAGPDIENTYAGLHRVRGQAREARGFLTAYAPDSSPALTGHLYALEGYAEVLLADVFCSGIPLSTVDFNADYTLAAGSSTADVYRHAVALFDSALALGSDSVRVQQFAMIGRGRALLALGRYAEAGAAVAAVPDVYRYQVVYTPVVTVTSGNSTSLLQMFGNSSTADDAAGYAKVAATPSMGDQEGFVGLDYRSSGDPRTAATAQPGTNPFGHTMYFPNKYPVSGNVTLTVADGIEARLIEAEAALQANGADGQWLVILDHLRQTAISPALPDTTDPGTPEARVDLLFRERAFWLYLTGHRQGDLRRLIRVYGRTPTAVYPRGAYQGSTGIYGNAVVAPVPAAEQERNDQYTGCIDLNA